MAGMMRQRFVDVTGELLDTVGNLAVLTADLSAEMFSRARARHPERVINIGIREQLLISMAGGMSLVGMRPIAHSFAPFLIERPFEQIKLDLNHQGVGAVLVSAGASYDIASGGRTHQSPGDVALLSTLPDWTIHVPGNADEAEAMLRDAAVRDDLVYIRLSNQHNRQTYATPGSGCLTLLRAGRQATVIVVGPLCDAVLEATADLDVTVLYAATVRPFDGATLRQTVADQPVPRVVLVEPMLEGTSSAEVLRSLGGRPVSLLPLGVPRQELRSYGTATQHMIAHGLDAAGLRRKINSFISE
ncbi:transketolase family protein [Nonomuraea sp. KM88]|uniref:transketolase family protein n=1 Tax=Nonomuraea sp. KM88 TaxID=3457427 RepID=UPI003FCE45A3